MKISFLPMLVAGALAVASVGCAQFLKDLNTTLEQTNTALEKTNTALNGTANDLSAAAKTVHEANEPIVADGFIIIKPGTSYVFSKPTAGQEVAATLGGGRKANYSLLAGVEVGGQKYQIDSRELPCPNAAWYPADARGGESIWSKDVPQITYLVSANDNFQNFAQDKVFLVVAFDQETVFMLPTVAKAGGENSLLANIQILSDGKWKVTNLSGML